jgi:hypothetical protein
MTARPARPPTVVAYRVIAYRVDAVGVDAVPVNAIRGRREPGQ